MTVHSMWKYWVLLLLLLLVACQSGNPTPTAEVSAALPQEEATDTPAPTNTAVPPTAVPTATETPEPTATATETPTPPPTVTASPTPMPQAQLRVEDEANSAPLAGALVQLTGSEVVTMTEITGADGRAAFADLTGGSTLTVTVRAEGYLEQVTTLEVGDGVNELTIPLQAGYLASINISSANLRRGPGTAYESTGVVLRDDVLQVVGRSTDGEWLVVLTPDGEEGWLATSLMDTEIDLDQLTAVPAPPTPIPVNTATPAPTATPENPFAPGAFNGTGLRDSMVNTRWILEQMGGLLDRLYNGSVESCGEYMDYYIQLLVSPTYEGVPPAWQNVYNEYIFAIGNALTRNDGVASLCASGGGVLNEQAYGNARQSINQSLDRLNPAIVTANALLGQ